MHLLFLVPLTTGLVSGYLFKNAVDEMAYLTGVITIVSLFLSLVLAPWQLQLLLLVLVIISTRKFLLLNQSQAEFAETQSQFLSNNSTNPQPALLESELGKQEMTSKYRGVSYKPPMTTAITTAQTERELIGKYRGTSWNRAIKQGSKLQANAKLKYRGARASNHSSVEDK